MRWMMSIDDLLVQRRRCDRGRTFRRGRFAIHSVFPDAARRPRAANVLSNQGTAIADLAVNIGMRHGGTLAIGMIIHTEEFVRQSPQHLLILRLALKLLDEGTNTST